MIGFSISAGNQGSSSAHRWVLANYTEWRKTTTTVKTKNSLLVANHPRGGEIMFHLSHLLCHLAALTSVRHSARKQMKGRKTEKQGRETGYERQSSDSSIYSQAPFSTVESIIVAFSTSGHVLLSLSSLLCCHATTPEPSSMYIVPYIKSVDIQYVYRPGMDLVT